MKYGRFFPEQEDKALLLDGLAQKADLFTTALPWNICKY